MMTRAFQAKLDDLRAWREGLSTGDAVGKQGFELVKWAETELASFEEVLVGLRDASKMLEHAALVMHEAAPGKLYVDGARAVLTKKGLRR